MLKSIWNPLEVDEIDEIDEKESINTENFE